MAALEHAVVLMSPSAGWGGVFTC
uniref:Uncharacterized protein n=1 Tax=Anguilla anguilla TaxID=7936 RepID=A0A0E9VJA5_ANGAN